MTVGVVVVPKRLTYLTVSGRPDNASQMVLKELLLCCPDNSSLGSTQLCGPLTE